MNFGIVFWCLIECIYSFSCPSILVHFPYYIFVQAFPLRLSIAVNRCAGEGACGEKSRKRTEVEAERSRAREANTYKRKLRRPIGVRNKNLIVVAPDLEASLVCMWR